MSKLTHRISKLLIALLILLGLTFRYSVFPVQAQSPVVRAVLFYSPSCPHCHQVIEKDLPPLMEHYGEQLNIIGVDVSSTAGSALFGAAIERLEIPPDRQAVPMLIVGDSVLLGSYEIPVEFPAMIEQYLAQGGVDWPDIQELRDALAAAEATAQAAPETTPPAEPDAGTAAQAEATEESTANPEPTQEQEAAPVQPTQPAPPTSAGVALGLPTNANPSVGELLRRDPAGNTLAIMVLAGMLITVAAALLRLRPQTAAGTFPRPSVWILILCLIGAGVAAYLAYIETAQVEAVCGPVGDCNTVQQSEYARLFGVLPIGVLGLAGYAALLMAWLAGRFGSGRLASLASLALLGMSLFGVLFSIYLTFLEPFVIGATCAWCLSSAIIMTLLLWLSIPPGKAALAQRTNGKSHTGPRILSGR